MVTEFDHELDRLRIDTLRMFYMVRETVDKSLRAVKQRDRVLSQEVMDGDEDIDLLECQNEALGLRLLALKQPVARDLRLIIGCMRIASNLERMGDEAVNVVDRNLVVVELPEVESVPSVWSMGETCLELLDKTSRAFADNSFELAMEVRETQELAATRHIKAFRDLTQAMIKQQKATECMLQLTFMSYSFKRICERCFNIAESVIFIVKGLDVKHRICQPQS